jgi:hypothetical protein
MTFLSKLSYRFCGFEFRFSYVRHSKNTDDPQNSLTM